MKKETEIKIELSSKDFLRIKKVLRYLGANRESSFKERGWRYIFIEAGHLAQNIYLLSTSLDFNCCAIGGFKEKEIIELLDLKESVEVPVYLIAVC